MNDNSLGRRGNGIAKLLIVANLGVAILAYFVLPIVGVMQSSNADGWGVIIAVSIFVCDAVAALAWILGKHLITVIVLLATSSIMFVPNVLSLEVAPLSVAIALLMAVFFYWDFVVFFVIFRSLRSKRGTDQRSVTQ